MEGVIQAIEKLSQKNIIDYLLIIVPIIISLVAIFISIATAKRQNNIAMFELRYKALATIKRVLSFKIVFYITDIPLVIVEYFNACFDACIDTKDKVKAHISARQTLNAMEESILALSEVLDNSDKKILEKTFAMLSKLIGNAIEDRNDSQDIKDFKMLCLCLEKITVEKLTRKIFGSKWCFDYADPEMPNEPNKIDPLDVSATKKIIADIVKEEEKQAKR